MSEVRWVCTDLQNTLDAKARQNAIIPAIVLIAPPAVFITVVLQSNIKTQLLRQRLSVTLFLPPESHCCEGFPMCALQNINGKSLSLLRTYKELLFTKEKQKTLRCSGTITEHKCALKTAGSEGISYIVSITRDLI